MTTVVRDGDDELSDSILLLSGVRPRHKIQHEDHSRGPGLVHDAGVGDALPVLSSAV